jgi:metal-responsive CopG/Arc/MetJ family transcriptional regulator
MEREVVLSIRVDRHLAEALSHVPNRSEFIRDAIRHALARQCPTCHGSGVLTTDTPKEPETSAAPDIESVLP